MAVITTIEDLRVLAQKRVPRNGMDTPNFTNSKFAVKVKVPSASALKQAAIDQHAFAGAFDQVARAGEAAAGAVKGKFHVDLRNSVATPRQRWRASRLVAIHAWAPRLLAACSTGCLTPVHHHLPSRPHTPSVLSLSHQWARRWTGAGCQAATPNTRPTPAVSVIASAPQKVTRAMVRMVDSPVAGSIDTLGDLWGCRP